MRRYAHKKSVFGTPFCISAWNKEIENLIPGGSGVALDIGCGCSDGTTITKKGYYFIGLDQDILGDHVNIVGDGENIPIKSETIDLVTSVRVIEHLPDPFQANREIFRVLKKEGVYVGSVAFLESYHANSYFHMTHKGLRLLLERCGFEIIIIENDSARSNFRNGIEGLIAEEFYLPVPLRPFCLDLFRPISWGIGILTSLGFLMRQLVWKILLTLNKYPNKKELIEQYKEEEKHWFARGFRFMVVKH